MIVFQTLLEQVIKNVFLFTKGGTEEHLLSNYWIPIEDI